MISKDIQYIIICINIIATEGRTLKKRFALDSRPVRPVALSSPGLGFTLRVKLLEATGVGREAPVPVAKGQC